MSRYDKVEIRCPKLGCEITFAYCRQEQGDLPCARTVKCWQPYISVEGYLNETLSREDRERFYNTPPKGKIATIFDTVAEIEGRKK